MSYGRIAGYGRPDYDSIGSTTDSVSSSVATVKPETNSNSSSTDTVYFTGTKHYRSVNATKAYSCKPGKARITAKLTGKHPYHLVKISGGGSTVNGWVDAKYVSENKPNSSPYQCIHTVVKGDSLWELAEKYLGKGKRYKEIMTLNGKADFDIRIGEKLKIPNK